MSGKGVAPKGDARLRGGGCMREDDRCPSPLQPLTLLFPNFIYCCSDSGWSRRRWLKSRMHGRQRWAVGGVLLRPAEAVAVAD